MSILGERHTISFPFQDLNENLNPIDNLQVNTLDTGNSAKIWFAEIRDQQPPYFLNDKNSYSGHISCYYNKKGNRIL